MANAAFGKAKMDRCADALRTQSELLASLVCFGHRPAQDWADPVEWRPRDKNVEADQVNEFVF